MAPSLTRNDMVIYGIQFDVTNYQYLLCADSGRAGGLDMIFDCDRRGDSWDPPEVYVGNPKAKRGDFFSIMANGFYVCTERVREELEYLFYPCAEMLPLPFEDETLYLINVLTCLNLLDEKRTEYHGALPKKYVFHPTRMQQAPLFKIPQTSRVQVLASQGFMDPEYDFKLQVEQRGFEGLIFKNLWSDEKGSR